MRLPAGPRQGGGQPRVQEQKAQGRKELTA